MFCSAGRICSNQFRFMACLPHNNDVHDSAWKKNNSQHNKIVWQHYASVGVCTGSACICMCVDHFVHFLDLRVSIGSIPKNNVIFGIRRICESGLFSAIQHVIFPLAHSQMGVCVYVCTNLVVWLCNCASMRCERSTKFVAARWVVVCVCVRRRCDVECVGLTRENRNYFKVVLPST